jgi:hypothetical protein
LNCIKRNFFLITKKERESDKISMEEMRLNRDSLYRLALRMNVQFVVHRNQTEGSFIMAIPYMCTVHFKQVQPFIIFAFPLPPVQTTMPRFVNWCNHYGNHYEGFSKS